MVSVPCPRAVLTIARMSEKAYYVSASYLTGARETMFASSTFTEEAEAVQRLREYRRRPIRLVFRRFLDLGKGPRIFPRVGRLCSVGGHEVERTWLDGGVSPPGAESPPVAYDLPMFNRTEFQIWVTSDEKPNDAEFVRNYRSEADARARIAEIGTTRTCRVDEFSNGPERSGVTCYLARVHQRILDGSDSIGLGR